MSEKTVGIETKDGTATAHVFHPDGTGPWPGVLFYMDGVGIRPALFEMGRRLAGHGYYVLLPNMYYRWGVESIPYAEILSGGPGRDKLMEMIVALNQIPDMGDARAYLDFLAAQPEVKKGKVGTHGYCMGGGHALKTAGHFPDRVAAAGLFHAGNLATDQPSSPHLLTDRLKARVYVGVAGIDPHLFPGETDRLDAALKHAGVPYQLDVYEGAQHGYSMTDLPVYDRVAAERHWDRLLELYGQAL